MCCRYYIDEDAPEFQKIIRQMNSSPLLARWQESAPIVTRGEVRPTDVVPVIAPDRRGGRAVFPLKSRPLWRTGGGTAAPYPPPGILNGSIFWALTERSARAGNLRSGRRTPRSHGSAVCIASRTGSLVLWSLRVSRETISVSSTTGCRSFCQRSRRTSGSGRIRIRRDCFHLQRQIWNIFVRVQIVFEFSGRRFLC